MITKEVNIVVKETGMDQVNKSIQNLENTVHDTEQATKNFKTQIREANQELLKMSQKFGETSKEAVEAAKKVADLKDQMGLANDLVNSFNPDQKFKALGAATQVAGTGLQGVTAGMALFGEQSEDTQKTLLQVQAAMSFSDAISNLSNLGDQWIILKTAIQSGSVFQKVFTAGTVVAAMVQKAFTGSVTATSVGFKVLRGAIIATGIGALVVGVGLLIANFDEVKKVGDKVSKSFRDFAQNNRTLWATLNVMLMGIPSLIANFEKLAKGIMPIINAITDFIGVTSESGRVIDKQKDVAEKALKQNEAYLKKNEHKLSEARKREIELSNEHYQRIIDGEITKEESLKILREKYQIDRQKKQDEANKIQAEKDKEARAKAEEKRVDDEKKAEEKKLQKIKDDAQKAYDLDQEQKQILADDQKAKDEETEAQEDKEIEAGTNRMARIQAEYDAQALADKKASDDKILAEKTTQDALVLMAESTASVFDSLEILGLKKSKAAQTIRKGIALAQIAVDTSTAISTAIPMAIKAGKEAAAVAGPAAPVVGPLATFASYAGSAAMIFGNVAKAKQLLGSGGSGSTGGGGNPSAPQAPSFNLVQGTGTNQIAQSLQKQAPIKTYVVAKDVTSGQSFDRNIIESASL